MRGSRDHRGHGSWIWSFEAPLDQWSRHYDSIANRELCLQGQHRPGLLPAHERADAAPDNTLFDARLAGLERFHAGAGLASAEEPMRVSIARESSGQP